MVHAKEAEFKEQYAMKETSLSVKLRAAQNLAAEVLTADSTDRLLSLLLLVPHGVAKMSHAVQGERTPHPG